jgi:hypothetical protein
LSEITAFWKGSHGHARQRRQVAGGLNLNSVALLGMLLLGALDPNLWRDMAEAPYLIGLLAAMICFGLAQPGRARGRSIAVALLPGFVLTLGEALHLDQAIAVNGALYLMGVCAGALVIATERWLPALGLIGDRSRVLGFTARWQLIVASTLLVHFLILIVTARTGRLTDLLHAEVAGILAMTLVHFSRIAMGFASESSTKKSFHTALVLLLGAVVVAPQLLWVTGIMPRD